MLASGLKLPDVGEHHWQPIGLVPNQEYRERHAVTPESARGSEFLCRFFDSSTRQCRAYEFRPSECRFYFCEGMSAVHVRRSERGFATEAELAQLCLKHLVFTEWEIHRQIDVLNLEARVQSFDTDEMLELYLKAWSRAGQLGASDVREMQ